MIRNRKILVPLFIAIVCAHGCSLFSSKSGRDGEVVFAPTEVGAPEGTAVTKNIGPAGGTLASPDGRLTLTVPQNALAETASFSIQPITNKADNGLGLAYRLEPDGKTFTTPLDLSVRYDDNDLEGTVPEALSIAYQDKKGAWHVQNSAKLDKAAKTLTVSTTHFTDEAFLARLRMRPSKATLHVGESQSIELISCEELGFIDKLLGTDPRDAPCSPPPPGKGKWQLNGPGTIAEYGNGVMYTAPAKKPTPNIANVDYTIKFKLWDEATGRISLDERSFRTKITIIDQGYRASGGDERIDYIGVICSLEKPFTVTGIMGPVKITNEFTPTSGLAGTGTSTASYGAALDGGGPYAVVGMGTDKPQIIYNVASKLKLHGAESGGTAPAHIDLIPLTGDECKGQ